MECMDARAVALQVIEAHEKKSNPYQCLLLPETASFLDVRAAYKRLLFLHPDKNPNLDVAHEAFKIVIAAYNDIRADSQTSVPDLKGGNNNAASVGNKWRAYTSAQAAEQATHEDRFRGGIPSQPSAAPSPPPQQPTAWNSLPTRDSKWGRPSADAHSFLKDLKPSASRLKPASLPQSRESEERDVPHRAALPSRQENDLSKPSSGEHSDIEHEDGMEINCGSFYGDTRGSAARKKQNQKQQQLEMELQQNSVPSLSRAPLPPRPQHQKWKKEAIASKWSDVSKKHPLSELLRNPEAAAPVAAMKDAKEEKLKKKQKRPAPRSKSKAQQKRQARTRVVIDSDSDDDFNNRDGKQDEEKLLGAESDSNIEDDEGHEGAGGNNSNDGWGSEEEEDIVSQSETEDIVSKAAGKAKSKALINLLVAQQRSQATSRLQAGTGQRASQRAAFGRRGGKRRKQTRLRLGPITSK